MSQTVEEKYAGVTFQWKEPHPMIKELQNLYSWKEYHKSGIVPNRTAIKQCNTRIAEIKEILDSRNKKRKEKAAA